MILLQQTIFLQQVLSVKIHQQEKYLLDHDVAIRNFNSYGSRRGNHEVMVRGTFCQYSYQNQLAPGTEGGFTTYWPTGENNAYI